VHVGGGVKSPFIPQVETPEKTGWGFRPNSRNHLLLLLTSPQKYKTQIKIPNSQILQLQNNQNWVSLIAL